MKINFNWNDELLFLNKIFNFNGDNLRIVGGAVRNFLLNNKINDIDLSCKFKPDIVLKILTENNVKTVLTGLNFGTVIAILNNKKYEITSTRKDIKTDGRKAIVEYIDNFEIDSIRRDFTFNALYLDFNGNIYDYHNGINDLKNGIVKFIGNADFRIKEDYLRILRLFRFYSFYGKIIDNDALKYSIKYKENLKNISSERIKEEMFKILISPNNYETLNLMLKNDILQQTTKINSFNIEYLKNKNKFLNLKIIISLLIENIDNLNILKNNWKLSNNEYKSIFNILKNKNIRLKNDFDIKKLLFNGIDKNDLINTYIYQSIINNKQISLNFVDKINNILVPVFPINGYDLNKLNINKKEYSKIIIELKEEFINSNFSLSKNDLIKLIKENSIKI